MGDPNDDVWYWRDHASPVVRAILDDLTDRRGLRQVWNSIDPEGQREVMDRWDELLAPLLRTDDAKRP